MHNKSKKIFLARIMLHTFHLQTIPIKSEQQTNSIKIGQTRSGKHTSQINYGIQKSKHTAGKP